MKPGIIWSRVSTIEQSYGYSLEAQTEKLQSACAEKEIDVIHEFEIPESGSRSEKRKHFRKMLQFVKDRKIQYVCAYKIDRLARNYKDFYEIQELIENGVEVFIVHEGRIYNKKSSSGDRFLFRELGSIAQYEAEQIGERTALGMNRKLQIGQICWESPIGYLNVIDPADLTGRRRTVIVDPERSPLVRKMFELYSTGDYSLAELASEMDSRGLKSKPGKNRSTHKISLHCAEGALKNRFFIGEFLDKKTGEWRKHHYGTFIDLGLFNAVQHQLQKANHNAKGRRDEERFFYKPLLTCGYCGSRITAYTTKGRTYYVCTGHGRPGEKRCRESRPFTEEKIDRLFTDSVHSLYIDDVIADRIVADLKSNHESEQAVTRRELRRLQSEQTQLTTNLSTIYQDRLAGLIGPEECSKLRMDIRESLASIEGRMKSLSASNSAFVEEGSQVLELLKGFRSAYLGQDYQGRAKILRVILKSAKLRGAELDLEWNEPFGILFNIGTLSSKKSKWGGVGWEFILGTS
jgi:DNA invertase Pin-like site-specific DNA recombinase